MTTVAARCPAGALIAAAGAFAPPAAKYLTGRAFVSAELAGGRELLRREGRRYVEGVVAAQKFQTGAAIIGSPIYAVLEDESDE